MQMRSFRDLERLLYDLPEVMSCSCGAGAWPGWHAGRPKAEATRPKGELKLEAGPTSRQQTGCCKTSRD